MPLLNELKSTPACVSAQELFFVLLPMIVKCFGFLVRIHTLILLPEILPTTPTFQLSVFLIYYLCVNSTV